MRAIALTIALSLSGCWKTDVEHLSEDIVPLNPEVGAPDGWIIERFEMPLACPNKQPASFYLVYPEDAVVVEDEPVSSLPLAIVFHSGAFDFIFAPVADDVTAGTSYQQTQGASKRLTLEWTAERIFTTLGLYPNYDPVELHAGALPAALAAKGIAMMLPGNCWGDLWHNRQALAENNRSADLFARDGRTAAEFAFLHATTEFPSGNPVQLPIAVDLERIYLIGLGEGSRAVSELMSISYESEDGGTTFPYRDVAGVVVDSPVDDLRPFYAEGAPEAFLTVRSGLNRIFRDGVDSLMDGSIANIPPQSMPRRFGMLYSANDTRIPAGANDAALTRLRGESSDDIWIHESIEPEHVISNSAVDLSKAIADFLVGGVGAIDPGLQDR